MAKAGSDWAGLSILMKLRATRRALLRSQVSRPLHLNFGGGGGDVLWIDGSVLHELCQCVVFGTAGD